MNVVRLTRWKPPSSARRKRRRRSGIAAVAVSALLVLAACSGGPDAPATVAPTATPDQPETYEPTLPPYTSEVELSAEDEKDVEELLLLIDEFMTLTSTLESGSREVAKESLRGKVDNEMLNGYLELMDEAYAENKRTSGKIVAKANVVVDLNNASATLATCYDYNDYIVSTASAPGVHLYPDRPKAHAYDTVAKRDGDNWLIVDRFDSEIECDE